MLLCALGANTFQLPKTPMKIFKKNHQCAAQINYQYNNKLRFVEKI